MSRLRRALTLVELIVVLLILVALAGVLLPRFPGILTQAHVAATTTNVPTIQTAVETRRLLRAGDIGNNFDALVVDPAGAPSIPSYMAGSTFWEPLTLTPDDGAALAAIGVTRLVPSNAPGSLVDNNATFGSHTLAPSAASAVCAMQVGPTADAAMLASFNMTPAPGARYLALGIGSFCTLIGSSETATMSEPPIHFGDTADTRANLTYARYMLIIELQNAGTANASARYLGAAAPHENGLERNEVHLAEFYNG